MTRPHIIRADTIDLQSTIAPSAKDHSRQPTHPAPLGDGPPAPHQAIALKQAEQDVEFHPRSPRMSQDLSNKELQLLHDDSDSIDSTNGPGSHHDLHDLHRNGGPNGGTGEGIDGDDGSGDDGSEDDMMDKISSSPSIEDGGSYLLLSRPSHSDSPSSLLSSSANFHSSPTFPSLTNLPSSTNFPSSTTLPSSANNLSSQSENDPFSICPSLSPSSSSSYLSCAEDPDIASSESKDHHHHHQKGEYTTDRHSLTNSGGGECPQERVDSPIPSIHEGCVQDEDLDDSDLDLSDLHQLLIPADDAILDNSFDDASLSPISSDSPPQPRGMHPWERKALADDDDDPEDFPYSNDPRFIDSGWGGECLRKLEDIDFAFVYALHTFIATVEGQANATKGDTMVLLDDTNSYWWLVRVVKDGSIGYLPAEHIETPTERLARLNKHRNIDLSQAMLGDNQEKSKNPLKKAMRRRNAKTVQFAPPTYVDAPNVEYSTEEEAESDGEYGAQAEESSEVQDGDQEVDANETATVEPLKSRTQGNEISLIDEAQQASGDSQIIDDQRNTTESERTSDETFERPEDANAAGRSRKGTLRNTDSFFKDDNMETRKINLTPSLLRDDSSGSTVKSTDGKEQYTRGSLDSLEKPQSTEKGKEEKKRKEKKGILGGLFKRKEKKIKGHEEDMEESKRSLEEPSRSSPQPKESSESLSQENQKPAAQSPTRQSSKLQKAPPTKLSSGVVASVPRSDLISPPISTQPEPQKHHIAPPTRAPPSIEIDDDTEFTPASRSDPDHQAKGDLLPLRSRSGNDIPPEAIDIAAPQDTRREVLSTMKDGVAPSHKSDIKPEAVKSAPPSQHRMALDEDDSSSEADEVERAKPLHPNSSQHPQTRATTTEQTERLSESPVDVARPDQSRMQNNPPGLVVDTSSQDDPPTISPSSASSAELIEAPRNQKEREATPASTSQSSSTSTVTWSDANLRAYLEDESEIRDLLTLVKDKSDMKPPSRDHPLVKDLFKDENQKLAAMSKELDGLLDDFLARRAKARREKSLEGISHAQF